jgi:hypothetical protein
VVPLYDCSIALCRQAGFTDVLLRGDTDFSLTAEFDRWDADGVRFVFGYDARANLVERAEGAPGQLYQELATRAERAIKTSPRAKPANVKDAVVRARGYKALRQKAEDVVEFSYRPGNCGRDYRVVALRKDISVDLLTELPGTYHPVAGLLCGRVPCHGRRGEPWTRLGGARAAARRGARGDRRPLGAVPAARPLRGGSPAGQ